ncbi:MAG: hypothetical protein A2Z43_03635 [Syntrophobacterales bacterium RBG_19FT_COMBO_59_10]|nr:MAG: hypothetical protein A2Z43_03635 [Syntrophobacterales bacterium RBG_19FT_COMBO_59_10]
MNKQVAITMRFDPNLYERIKTISRGKGRSITAFVQEAVARKITEEEADVLFDAFTLVGKESRDASVEYACDAQREVILKDG